MLDGPAEGLTASYMYWVAMDTNWEPNPVLDAELNKFYYGVHSPEVVAANTGFLGVARYVREPEDQAADKSLTPRWLAAYPIDVESSVSSYLDRDSNPDAPRPRYSDGPDVWANRSMRWKVFWRQVGGSGRTQGFPGAINITALRADLPSRRAEKVIERDLVETIQSASTGESQSLTLLEAIEYTLYSDSAPRPRYVIVSEGSAPFDLTILPNGVGIAWRGSYELIERPLLR